jgi:transcriptional regulator
MYLPRHYEETRLDVLHALVKAHPLGALVRMGASGLDAHVARANPLWREAGTQAMVLFQGPSAYITPGLYEEKSFSGKVVPTWNYAVVHAHGTLHAIDDRDWLLALLERLTRRHEHARATPWSIGDAPADYIEKMSKAVVGIEISIERLEGKWKASQNRSEPEQERMAAGLASEPGGKAFAQLMRERLGG